MVLQATVRPAASLTSLFVRMSVRKITQEVMDEFRRNVTEELVTSGERADFILEYLGQRSGSRLLVHFGQCVWASKQDAAGCVC